MLCREHFAHTCSYVYVYMQMYMVCTHEYICMYIHIYIYIYIYANIYVCVYMYIYNIYLYVYVFFAHTHTRIHAKNVRSHEGSSYWRSDARASGHYVSIPCPQSPSIQYRLPTVHQKP